MHSFLFLWILTRSLVLLWSEWEKNNKAVEEKSVIQQNIYCSADAFQPVNNKIIYYSCKAQHKRKQRNCPFVQYKCFMYEISSSYLMADAFPVCVCGAESCLNRWKTGEKQVKLIRNY